MPNPYDKKEELWAISERHTLMAKTIKERVFEHLDKHPQLNFAGLYFQFGPSSKYNYKRSTLKNYFSEWKKKFRWEGLKKDIRLMFNIFYNKMKPPHVNLSKEETYAIKRLELFALKED